MAANTAIGEVGLCGPGGQYAVLRPSLRAMSSLGDGRALVELFAYVHGGPTAPAAPTKRARLRAATDHFSACCDVLAACAGDVDISVFTGHAGERYGTWRPGLMDPHDVVVLAQHLTEHGLSGVRRAPRGGTPVTNSSQYLNEIFRGDYAAQAIAHLGLSQADAWNLTMTAFVAAMHAKFDPKGERDALPTEEEHDRTMTWLEAINAQRDAHKRSAP